MHAMSVYTHACKFATSVTFAKYKVEIIFMLQFKGLSILLYSPLYVPATNDVLFIQ